MDFSVNLVFLLANYSNHSVFFYLKNRLGTAWNRVVRDRHRTGLERFLRFSLANFCYLLFFIFGFFLSRRGGDSWRPRRP